MLNKGTLSYYKDPKDAEALGTVPIPGCIIAPPDPGKRLFNKFGFKVSILAAPPICPLFDGRIGQVSKQGQRSYYFCADDAKDMYRWMNALSLAAIQYEKVRSMNCRLQCFA